ncbi:MAG: imidazole glycerol phosphate synthase subunit HisH [Gammaproteobacteria bacterium]|nr:imidazole glycerol phosphate synthase subunit HisH [Gammaproteobacteria bacterium]
MAIVAVIDYGMGNLHSVAKALGRVSDIRVEVTSDASLIRRADRVVLPGVGAMRDCISEIKRLGLDDVIYDVAKTKPFLGVCVGMQALMDFSEENAGVECLGIVPGSVKAFEQNLKDPLTDAVLKVPHMGWNQVYQATKHPLWRDIPQDSRFYFVHSYYAQPEHPGPVAASTSYGHPFASALVQDNIFAVQFHPEKSQQAGLTLYANFVNWDGQC